MSVVCVEGGFFHDGESRLAPFSNNAQCTANAAPALQVVRGWVHFIFHRLHSNGRRPSLYEISPWDLRRWNICSLRTFPGGFLSWTVKLFSRTFILFVMGYTLHPEAALMKLLIVWPVLWSKFCLKTQWMAAFSLQAIKLVKNLLIMYTAWSQCTITHSNIVSNAECSLVDTFP